MLNRFIVLSFALMCMGSSLFAQGIELYGLWYERTGGTGSNFTGYQHFVQVNPNNGNVSLLDTIPGAKYVAVGASTFDHKGNRFIYWGIDGANTRRLYTIDAPTGNMLSNPAVSQRPPIELEFDMKNGKTYGLQWDATQNKEYFVEVNLQTGAVTRVKDLPGVQTVMIGSSTFNSNNGTFYFGGGDFSGNIRMYRVDAATGNILGSTTFANNVFEWQYDVTVDKLFGLHRSAMGQPLEIVELDTLNGQKTSVMTIPSMSGNFAGVVVGSSVYDQNTSTYIFRGVNGVSAGTDSIHFVRPGTRQQYAISLNKNVIEIKCDNTTFASRFYNNTQTNNGGIINDIVLFRNMGISYINGTAIKLILPRNIKQDLGNGGSRGKPGKITLFDAHGKAVRTESRSIEVIDADPISIDNLPTGIYTLRLEADSHMLISKFIKQ
ncbi:MAG: T9SS type A sorting domain-containing protein [Bacteroidota bacterium]